MFELIFAGLALAGFLVLLDRKDKRTLETLERDREAHRAEVQTLLQRIQAPEIAVVEHQQATAVDENPYPLTDEESAEAQDERARVIAEIERMENEGVLT